MSEFKEFQGKNLDEAINSACDYFNLNRDKLEIEILSGGSTGVFGLVGKKNAKVKARPRGADNKPSMSEEARNSRPRHQRSERPIEPRQRRQPEEPKAPENRKETESAPHTESEVPAVKPEAQIAVKEESEVAVKSESELAVRDDVSAPVVTENLSDSAEETRGDTAGEYIERRSIMEGDPEDIAAAVREALEMMIEPIVQAKPKLEIEVGEDRVNVLVDDEENSGLIIGREGQTLSSLQYLCNRMVSKKLQTSVRVQIDTGDYRERQDEKLRQLAWHLADKAMHTGRVQSTKPLSSYHRRVVHMALQEDKYVNTRSKGEGPMKRVLILPRRSRNAGDGRRNDKFNSQKPERYNSRGSERSERNDRSDRSRGPRDRNENYGNRSNDNYGGRSRNENYGNRSNNYGSRSRNENYGSRPRNENVDGRTRNEGYGNRNQTDNYGGRSRTENYGNRPNNNYGSRGRNENYGSRPRSNNYDNRNRNENFGNRAPAENFGNRAPEDHYRSRQPRNNSVNHDDHNNDTGPDKFNSERYNRYE